MMTLVWPTYIIFCCRINAITFKSFVRTATIKNKRLVVMLIAEKTTWGVSTSYDKRNKMSMLGIFSYVLFLPEIYFLAYDWWVFITTGVAEICKLEKIYLGIMIWFYFITVCIKAGESGKYRKGDIW